MSDDTSSSEGGFSDNFLTATLDRIKGVHLAGKNLFAIKGDASQLIDWNKMGLKISIQPGSMGPNDSCEMATAVFVAGKYKFPEGANIVSAIYAIAISKPLLKPIEVWMQHCVALQTHHHTGYLGFALAPVIEHIEPPYCFKFLPGGQFFPENEDGTFSYKNSDIQLICIAKMPHIITYQ